MTTIDNFGPYGQATSSFEVKRGREKSFPLRGRVVLGVLFALLLIGGIGGWFGVGIAKRFPLAIVRGFVVATGLALSVYYFLQG